MRALTLAAVLLILTSLVLVIALTGCGGGGTEVWARRDVAVPQLQALLLDGQPLTIVDISAESVFATRHIPGSLNIATEQLADWAAAQDRSMRICFVCT
jgi:hypothetical protein